MTKNSVSLRLETIADLPKAAQQLLNSSQGRRIWLFNAPLGTGKTTLIKAICQALGSEDKGSSPTYALANEYRTQQGEVLFHLDLYRLQTLEEAFEMGIEEYINGSNYCFIEWANLIEPLLDPENTLQINMKTDDNGFRYCEMEF